MIRYDTVSKLHWNVDVRTHGIAVVVDKLLSADWEEDDEEDGGKKKGGVPDLTEETDCAVRVFVRSFPIFLCTYLHAGLLQLGVRRLQE